MNISDELKKKVIETVNNIELCWQNFITNHTKEAMKALDTIFVNMDYIIYALSSTDSSFQVNDVYNIFTKIEASLRVKDYVLSADLLKYELKTILIRYE